MTKDETLLVFTLVVSSVSIFLFGILLFMVLISATRDFRERTKSKLVKIMIWAGIVVITFAIAVRIYPIFIFLLKERIKPLVEVFSCFSSLTINQQIFLPPFFFMYFSDQEK